MRFASHVIALGASRMQPCEAALPSGSERPLVPWMPIWPGPALELLEDVRARADGERVRAAVVRAARSRAPPRRRTGRTASASRPSGTTAENVRTSRPSRKTATVRFETSTTRRHSVDDRIVWSARIQPVCPLGPAGEPDVHPAVAVLALDGAHHGEHGAHLRERPHGGDRLDDARLRAGRGVGDVILEQDHERLGHGDVRRRRVRTGPASGGACAGDHERRRRAG